jgi:hypothetical protein
MHTIELLGRADKVHKIKLIGILKEYTGFGLDKTETAGEWFVQW